MKKVVSRIWKFGKTVIIPGVVAAVPIAAQGTFGPKAQAVAVAVGALWGVLSRRPQDEHPAEKAE